MSKTSHKALIPFSKITHISKQVTEEITQKNFKNFLQTTLTQENFELTQESYIFHYFIKEANQYEIYLLKSYNKIPILEFQLFEEYTFTNFTKEKYFLFITNNFFVVYQNKKPLFAFENKHYTKDDITKFIQFTHKIVIDEVITIEEHSFETLKSNFKNIQPLIFERYKNDHGYFYFIGYLFLIIGFASYLFIGNQQPSTIQNIENNKPSPYIKKNITNHLATFLSRGYANQIEFKQLRFNKKLYVSLSATHTNLQAFLSFYKNVTITKLEKSPENILIAEIELEF